MCYSVVLTQQVSHHLLSLQSQVVQVSLVGRVKKVALRWVLASVLWVSAANFNSLSDPYCSLFGGWYSKPQF